MASKHRLPLPHIFPVPGSRVRVPAKGGGYIKTFAGDVREVDGKLVIHCAGCGDVPAGMVKAYEQATRSVGNESRP